MNCHSGDRQKLWAYRMPIGKEGIQQVIIPVNCRLTIRYAHHQVDKEYYISTPYVTLQTFIMDKLTFLCCLHSVLRI